MTNGTGGGAGDSGRVVGMNFKLSLFLLSPLLIVAAMAADLAPARAMLAKKDFPAAIAALETITAAEPTNAEAHLALGNALSGRIDEVGLMSKAGLAKRSLAAYERAAALDARSVGARLALVQYYMQAPFFAGGSREKAYASAKELVALDAWHGNFWLMRLYQEDKKPAEAFAACDALLQVEPGSYRALYQLGRMVALTGQQRERGVAALRQAVTLTPGAEDPARSHAYNRLGQILESMGDVAGARVAYDRAVELDPKLEDAKQRRAKLK